jgi:hypothetical protein
LEKFELDKYSNRLDLLKETVEQIQKDFGESGFSILFSGNPQTAYNELIEQILPFIQQLLKSNYSHLMQVLYKIDIPEKLFKNILKDEASNVPLKIAELIIKRELQKVVIRNHYKKNLPGNPL